MSGFFDPLESAVDSFFGVSTTSDGAPTRATSSSTSLPTSRTTSVREITSSASAQQTPTSLTTPSQTNTSTTPFSSVSSIDSTTPALTSPTTTPSTPSMTSSPMLSTTSSSSVTSTSTFTTSILFTSSSISSTISSSSITTSSVPVSSSSAPASSGSSSRVASIAVGSVIGLLAFGTILYVFVRYFPPIQRRLAAYKQRKYEERSFRKALDGLGISAETDEKDLGFAARTAKDRRSYLARNWYVGAVGISRKVEPPQMETRAGLGLDLGRASMLRAHALSESPEPALPHIQNAAPTENRIPRKPLPTTNLSRNF